MKRSLINTLLADAEDFFVLGGLHLPPFSRWSPEELAERVRKHGCAGIVAGRLGWQVTDYGLGSFVENGLVEFVARTASTAQGAYRESHIVLRDSQRIPLHTFRSRGRDLVNRSPATLLLRLYSSIDGTDIDENGTLDVRIDGQQRQFMPGETIALLQGESITLPACVYRELAASGGDLIATDISGSGADADDILFYDPVTAAQEIDDDEQPRRLLVQDYPQRFPDLR